MNDDSISRQAAIDAAVKESQMDGAYGYMDAEDIVDMLKRLPTAQPKTGKWIEQTVIENAKAAGIEEVQYARCSACGLYHTTPYMYYFTEYKFCPHCGARMVNEDE